MEILLPKEVSVSKASISRDRIQKSITIGILISVLVFLFLIQGASANTEVTIANVMACTMGIDVDSSGNIYVVDCENGGSLKKFPAGSSTPQTLIDTLQQPRYVVVDGSGNMYIGEWVGGSRSGMIKKFDSTGTGVAIITHTVSYPTLNIDSSGNLYYTDLCTTCSEHYIMKVPSGSTTPQTVLAKAPAVYDINYGIAVDSSGNIFFGSGAPKGISKLSAGSSSPSKLLDTNSISDIEIDSSGNLFYITNDPIRNLYMLKASSTTPETVVTGVGYDMALDISGNIYFIGGSLDTIKKLTLSPPSTTGSISVSSTPSGAKIYFDGENTGTTTPYTLTDVSEDTHTIKLTLSGYNDWSGSVTVNAGSTTTISRELTPVTTTGSISVSSTPSGAKIYLDGVREGITTPDTLTNVPEGNHTIKLKFSGYNDWSSDVTVIAGSTSTISPTLNSTPSLKPGSISVSSIPSGASIYLDGVYKGTAPMTLTDVPEGSHTVKLTYSGSEKSEVVQVSSGSTSTISIPLPTTPPTTAVSKTPAQTPSYPTPTPKPPEEPDWTLIAGAILVLLIVGVAVMSKRKPESVPNATKEIVDNELQPVIPHINRLLQTNPNPLEALDDFYNYLQLQGFRLTPELKEKIKYKIRDAPKKKGKLKSQKELEAKLFGSSTAPKTTAQSAPAVIPQPSIPEGSTCQVCLTEFSTAEPGAVKCPACNRLFHYRCIVKWVNQHKACPICKKEVSV